jgi:hypothetical protein
MAYQAVEKKDHWVVTYNPSNTNIRGGGGELRVEKATGKVTFVVGYR